MLLTGASVEWAISERVDIVRPERPELCPTDEALALRMGAMEGREHVVQAPLIEPDLMLTYIGMHAYNISNCYVSSP